MTAAKRSNTDAAAATIAGRMALRVADFVTRGGREGEALLRAASLDRSALTSPDARVSYAAMAHLGELALALTKDDAFGLHLAEDVATPGALDVGVLLLLASPTLGEALARMERFQRYWGDGERTSLHPTRGGLAVRYTLPFGEGAYARHADECALAEITNGVRLLLGVSLAARAVRFRHAKPRSLDEHARVFGCVVTFGAPHTEIEFDDAALARPLPQANAMFCAVFEAELERAIARLPANESTASTTRAAAKVALGSGGTTLASVARSLGMSTRTLQRRLQDEGTSFAEILDALRCELATSYLARGVPLAEVSSLLGYADATAFHHAFQRWRSESPAKYVARR